MRLERPLPGRRLRGDRAGASTMILAGSLFALVGAASIAIDVGSVYLTKRRLQGIADAAALAAVADIDSDGESSARAVIDRSKAATVTIASLTAGRYHRDRSVVPSERFTADPASPNAARLVLREQVPLFFGRVLTGRPTMMIEAKAVATRRDMAAFSLGTRLAEVSGGLPNRILSALAGTELGLTAVDSRGLAAADVDILGFSDALRLRVQHPDATYAELFAMKVPLGQVIGAMADATAGGASATLAAIESRLGSGPEVRLSDLVDLGPIGESDYNDGTTGIRVDALSLLRSSLELSHGDHYAIGLDASAPGLASTSLKLTGGQGDVHSPWMTVTSAKDVVIRSSQARLYLETRIGTGPLGLVDIRLPIYIELARAEARLTAITCGDDTDGVTLAVTPAIGKLAIAEVDDTAMHDLTAPASLRPAALARTPLVKIQGFADVALGGTAPQSVHFTREDIAARRVRTVTTNDLARGIASSLVKDADIEASLLGSPLLGGVLSPGPLVSAVGSQLALVAPPLDALINELTATLGVRLGSADVRVDKMRCGVPMLVA